MQVPPDVDFEAAYQTTPPWEIGRPQPAVVEFLESASITGPILDVGCGTGENALEFARRGFEVVAIDASRAAIAQARAKSRSRGLRVEFLVADAYELSAVGRRFPTVVDSALLHVIPDRRRYVDQLRAVIEEHGRVLLFEISDAAEIPYPKISESEIRRSFPASQWTVESLETTSFDTHLGTFPAWFGVVRTAGIRPTRR